VTGIVAYVFGIIGLLTLIGFLPAFARRINLPYTVLLAVVGLGLGGIIVVARNSAGLGALGDFLHALDGFSIPAEAFLAIFLPTLLFETALAIDIRRLMEDVAPVLLMAVVAVILCAFFVGAALSWSFALALPAALLLGSIVATTDPIAVVGIFRDLGAPKRLLLLVEGESLFNDAAAIALYGLLIALLTGEHGEGIVEAILTFLRDFIGGAIFGYVAAWVALRLARWLRGLPEAEITLTVALAYLAYIVGEHYVHVSGVVAVVVAALTLGGIGRTRFTPTTWHRLEHTWQQLGFWANSLIFLLAAMLVPRLIQTVSWEDVLMLAVLILSTLVARSIVVFGLMPLLGMARLARASARPMARVIVWGGLRGAVSGAGAASPRTRPPPEESAISWRCDHRLRALHPARQRHQPPAAGQAPRPDKLPPAEQALRDRGPPTSRSPAPRQGFEVAAAAGLCPQPVAAAIEEYDRRIARPRPIPRWRTSPPAIGSGRRRLASWPIARASWRSTSWRRASCRAASRIHDPGCGPARRRAKVGGLAGYEQAAKAAVGCGVVFRIARWLHQHFRIERLLAGELAERFERLLLERMMLIDLGKFVDHRLEPVLGGETAATMHEVLGRRAIQVEQALAALRLQYPDYAELLEGRYLGRVSLRLEEDAYRDMLQESVVSQEIFNDLDRHLGERRRRLEQRPGLDVALSPEALIPKVPLFADLAPARQAAIAKLLRPRLALPEERIVAKGERGDAMYFITSGAVSVDVPSGAVRLGSGDFFGEIALVAGRPRTADVWALGYCSLLTLLAGDFSRLLSEDAEMKRTIDEVARQRLGVS
jgi:CPA1 family monovalent cation:H+ antiporter